MLCKIVIFVATIVVLQIAAAAFPQEDEPQLQHIVFTSEDAQPESKWDIANDDRESGFIGDLIIGQRNPNIESVYSRLIEINNPTNEVISNWFTLNVDKGGVVHFLSVINIPGSYSVVCDDPYSLGGANAGFRVRSPPNSRSVLTITLGVHYS